MNSQPAVSIIIVTYNADKLLQRCLDSIFTQSYKNYELLIYDGKSTDKTIDIIKSNQNQIDFWKSEKDSGIYNAMNKAIKHAKGEWVYFLGSDDELLPGFSDLASKLENNTTIYYGNCITDNENILLQGKYNNYRLAKMNICHHSIFYPSSIFKTYLYEEKYIVSADHALNIILWNNKNFTWKYIPILVAKYYLNGFSAKNKDINFKNDREKIVKKYLGLYAFLRFKLKRFKERNNPKSYVN